MGQENGTSKLIHDIKGTASDAEEIMRELRTLGVQEAFDKIREVAITAKEIMDIFLILSNVSCTTGVPISLIKAIATF